jgi:uncharacterized protein (DUF934 family)
MSKLIRNGQLVNDGWKILRLAEGDTPHGVKLPVGEVLVLPSVWQARRAELIHREYEHGWALGIWFAADQSPSMIERDIDDFSVIAVEFDKFSDGNSYLTARLLRERYGYGGELRAIGDVPCNKLSYLHQLGFDAVAATPGSRQFAGVIAHPADFSRTGPALVAAAA